MTALTPEAARGLVVNGGGARIDAEVPARFKPGDAIVARNINPIGHTRLPRYLRGRRGTVQHDHGVFLFPDTHAHGQGAKPQHLYSVRFSNQEIWGDEAGANDCCFVDVFDDYMDPA